MLGFALGNKGLEQEWTNKLRGSEKCLSDLQKKWKDNPSPIRRKQIREMILLHWRPKNMNRRRQMEAKMNDIFTRIKGIAGDGPYDLQFYVGEVDYCSAGMNSILDDISIMQLTMPLTEEESESLMRQSETAALAMKLLADIKYKAYIKCKIV